MEIFLGLALVAFVIWAGACGGRLKRQERARELRPARRSSSASQKTSLFEIESQFRDEIDRSVQRDSSRSSSAPELRRVERRSSADHVPPTPSGRGREAWSPRTQHVEVAGEWYRAEDLRTLFERHAKVSESGAEIRLPAVLVPDAANPHDGNAVAVFVDGLHVGYMERPDAKRYHQPISDLPGGELVVTSRQWLRASADDTWARVTLSLPLPEHLQCPNPFDGGGVSLPPGSTIQVTKEENHMEHLVGLLDRYGSDTVVAAALRSVTEERPRSSVDLVAVDIDGEQVGVLSTTQTANFLPLVRRAEADDKQVFCRASLRGNSLKADVALHARKAHQLDDAELKQLFGSSELK